MKDLSVNDKPASLGGRVARLALVLAVLLVIVMAGWTWLTLSWAYSVGERAGVLQKFSEKGWICKTYEGELAQYVVGGIATLNIAASPLVASAIHPTLLRASPSFRP